MRNLFWCGAMVLLAACATNGPCCSNSDCPGSNVCSIDDSQCPSEGHPKGMCLSPCQVDRDCGRGQVCNLIILKCGCEDVGDGGVDGGVEGTCAPGVGGSP